MFNSIIPGGRARRWYMGALLLAVAIRGYLLWQYYCISSDGVLYIRAAQDFFAANFGAGLQSIYPPGYPLVIATVFPLIGDWELAGQMMSLLLGVCLLVPLYWIFCGMFDSKTALLACYLAAANPLLALYSVHVRSESSYLFLATTAFYLFLSAIERRHLARFFFGGLVAGYAFLIRPEAIAFLLIVPTAQLVRWLLWREPSVPGVLRSTAMTAAGFLIFALPYIAYLSVETGRFGALSRKAGVTLAINLHESGLLDDGADGQEPDVGSFDFTEYVLRNPISYFAKVASDLIPALWTFFQALYYSYLPFLLLGWVAYLRSHVFARSHLLLIGFVLFYVFGFALVYVKRRYALQAVPLSLAWVALGMTFLWDQLRHRLTHRQARIAAACVALVFIAATLPRTLKPVSREKAFVRQAGWYLKARHPSGSLRVAAFDERVAFYANARSIRLTKPDPAVLRGFLREQQADYFAVEAKIFARLLPEVVKRPEHFGLLFEQDFLGTRKDRMLLFKVS